LSNDFSQRNTNLISNNNQDYARIDKSKGEDLLFITATATAAAAYAAFVGDGDPVDGLETIGQVVYCMAGFMS
jgi:hypothetical protein